MIDLSENNTLETINWETLTRSRAAILRRVARRRENALAQRMNDGDDVDDEWRRAVELEEDLSVFIITGLRPSGLTATV